MPRPSTSGGVMTFTLHDLGLLPAAGRRPDVLIEGRIGRLPAQQPIPDSARRSLRQNQRIAERERSAAAADAVQAKVQPGFKPPPGRLWAVDEAGLMLIGPKGAIGVTAAVVQLLALLSVGGRHAEAGIAAATGCRDVVDLRERLTGILGKLAAVGLMIDRRRTGIRVAKVRTVTIKP